MVDVLDPFISGPLDDVTYTTNYHYDGKFNRLKQVVYENGQFSVHNIYGSKGNLQQQEEVKTSGLKSKLMQAGDYDLQGRAQTRWFGSGGHIQSKYEYASNNGQISRIAHNSTAGTQATLYQYDGWGNLKQRILEDFYVDNNTETFTYDNLHQLVGTTRENGANYNYSYDALGNLEYKGDFNRAGSVNTYGGDNNSPNCLFGIADETPGPNAITKAPTQHNGNQDLYYYYDHKGNRSGSCGSSGHQTRYEYDADNLMVFSKSRLKTGSSFRENEVEFRYGSDNMRYYQHKIGDGISAINGELTLYGNKDYEEIHDLDTGHISRKYYLTDYLTVTKDQYGTRRHYNLKDRLGSTTLVVDEYGNKVKALSFDAFGKPRNEDWTDLDHNKANLDIIDNVSQDDVTRRGYTDHEHIDQLQLIHMNGRMYDFNNGRFLSVDPFIQGVTSQAINPYSYIQNNPLSGVDPTGYVIVNPVTVAIAQQVGRAIAAKVARIAIKNSGLTRYTGSGLSPENSISYKEFKKTIADGGTIDKHIFVEPPKFDPAQIFVQPDPVEPTPGFTPVESEPFVESFNGVEAGPTIMNSEQGDNSDIGSQADANTNDTSTRSPEVQGVLDGIEENGFGVTINENKPETQQEGNATIDFNDGTKVNIRVETHDIKGDKDVRHANVESTKKVKNKNKVTKNKHIIDEKKLDE